MITRDLITEGRTLLEKSFRCPWHYKQWLIECSACDGGTTQGECVNPECDGDSAPATFVVSPDEYPAYPDDPQVVATIDVPGLSDLAEHNGQCICWLRNNATALLDRAEAALDLEEALVFIGENSPPPDECRAVEAARSGGILDYARSLGWRRP